MQRLLTEAVWDEHGVRDEVQRVAVETLGREHVILALDETRMQPLLPARMGSKAEILGQFGWLPMIGT